MDLSHSHSMVGQHVTALVAREQRAHYTASPAPCTRMLAHASHLGHCWLRNSTAAPASSSLPGQSMPIQQVLTFSSTFKVLHSSFLSQPVQHSTQKGQNGLHSYWHGYPLLLKVNSRQRCPPWNFGSCMVFVTRAVSATILKSMLKEDSVKMEKGWKKLLFSVIKGGQ